MTKFYPEVKPHMSPSALAQWLNQRSAFVKSYFEGEKMVETKAMKFGTKVHRMIEAGLLPAKCAYDRSEETLIVELGNNIKFLGVPDSHTSKPNAKGIVSFVDYKTGKANEWKEKLPTDIKMKATAWLVWEMTGRPKQVNGAIEYIATEWSAEEHDIVPKEGAETEVIAIAYSAKELEAFTQVIRKAIDDVNAFYEKWLNKSEDFINKADTVQYAELKSQKDELDAQIKEVGQRILDQMEFGGLANVKTPLSSFYTITKKTYEYPEDIKVATYKESNLTLAEVEEIDAATKASLKNYELATEPKSESVSIGFRIAKEK